MADSFRLRASFIDIAHEPSETDARFYQSLPNVEFQALDPQTGHPAQAIPGAKNTVLAVITTIISSTALSQGIEAWLKKEPTRIEITVEEKGQKRSVVFEGPNIKESREQVEGMLKDLTTKPGQCAAQISATKLPRKSDHHK